MDRADVADFFLSRDKIFAKLTSNLQPLISASKYQNLILFLICICNIET